MASDFPLDWDTFLNLAKASGLDADHAHLQELYSYMQTVLPGLSAVHELDLSGELPAMNYFVPQDLTPEEP
jgi:Asp-tRNA(Asn)/Glu-tRNA(Gln) amidotransferase C subunit